MEIITQANFEHNPYGLRNHSTHKSLTELVIIIQISESLTSCEAYNNPLLPNHPLLNHRTLCLVLCLLSSLELSPLCLFLVGRICHAELTTLSKHTV